MGIACMPIEDHLFSCCVRCSLTINGRLEAATSRLEDMVPNYGDTSAILNGEPPLPDSGLDAATGTDQKRGNNSPERVIEPLPPAIEDFDAIINGVVQTFVSMSEDIGGLVAEQVESGLSQATKVTILLTTVVPVCCFAKSFHCPAQIPACHYQGEETRHPVTSI